MLLLLILLLWLFTFADQETIGEEIEQTTD